MQKLITRNAQFSENAHSANECDLANSASCKKSPDYQNPVTSEEDARHLANGLNLPVKFVCEIFACETKLWIDFELTKF